jgi:alpha-methylacyl-CoA racemase
MRAMGAGPLSGVRVVEIAGLGPVPFAAMLMADLGADVIRVDRPGGDPPPGGDPLARGRRSAVVDLKQPGGAEVVLRLVERADAMVEGFRPGVAERAGIGPEACLQRNPRLVYGRMTGWGQDGPLAATAGHDINYLSLTGVLHSIGPPEQPAIPLNLIGDFGGGAMYLVVGVLAALLEARQSGQGQVVDAAIVDGAAHLTTLIVGLLGTGTWRDTRCSNLLDGGAPFYNVYETSDGQYMSVGALEPQFYAELIDKLGFSVTPERSDPQQWADLRTQLAAAFASKTRAEWIEVFEGSDACVAPVMSLSEVAGHPHMSARSVIVEHEGVRQPAPAPRFSRTPGALSYPPARPGEHTREVLLDWGLTDVDELLSAGVVIQSHPS